MNGSNGNDTLIGGSGDDFLQGGVDDDALAGGQGKDTLNGLTGLDSASGTAAELDGDTIVEVEQIIVLSSGALSIHLIGGASEIALASGGNDLTFDGVANVTGGGAADAITATFSGIYDLQFSGNGGNDTITANTGDDTLTGGAGVDILSGWSGDDILNGGKDGDLLTGGSGNDTYKFVGVGDIVFEWSNGGTDTIETALAAASMPVNVENMTYTGKLDFTATGNSSNNVITGKAGKDTLRGEDGNDTLVGNNGDDDVGGGAGDDLIQGGDGSDTHTGGAGKDTASYETAEKGIDADLMRSGSEVITKAGTDHLTGIENLIGTDSDDVLRGNGADNVLTGSYGDDTMWGLAGDDVLNGVPGIDEFHPGTGDDTAYGDYGDTVDYADSRHAITASLDTESQRTDVSGRDVGTDVLYFVDSIVGGAGDDTFSFFTYAAGGAGDDWFQCDNDFNEIDGGLDFDTIYYDTSGPYLQPLTVDLLDNTKNAGLASIDTFVSIEAVASGDGNDNLYGDDNANRLSGGNNLDFLYGRGGNDTLDGGDFSDFLYGDDGFDTADYTHSSAAVNVDLVTNVNEGGDAFADFLASIEGVIGSAFADTISGNAEANDFFGDADNDFMSGLEGNDTLDGGAGNDTMNGGTQSDTYVVDSVADIVDETGGNGIDTVETDLSYTLLTGFEYLVLTGSDSINGTGNDSNNHLSGNAGNNVLNGLAGQDSIAGGGGDDIYYFNAAGDSADEVAGQGTDTLRSSITATIAANVENLIMTGSSGINGTGNTASNSMTGNSAGNLLDGLTGADTLNGGGGADTISFTTALGPSNIDLVSAYSVTDDTIQLENSIFTGLVAGTLAATAFVTGAAAADTTNRIIYNSTTGALLFDADGTGATAAIQFVVLPTALALSNLDFVIV